MLIPLKMTKTDNTFYVTQIYVIYSCIISPLKKRTYKQNLLCVHLIFLLCCYFVILLIILRANAASIGISTYSVPVT